MNAESDETLPVASSAGALASESLSMPVRDGAAIVQPTGSFPSGQATNRPPAMKFGAIDVGTNSIHLIMVEISPEGDFHVLGRDKAMVQLGKGGFAEHVLTDNAMEAGLGALTRFRKMASLKGVTKIKAVATSAVREARNGGDFVARVRGEVGLDLRVITMEEEARLIYQGVRSAVDLGTHDHLIIDIGGGSVEIVVGNATEASLLRSVKLGGSRLAELFLKNERPTKTEIKALRRHIEKSLGPILAAIGSRRVRGCIGTSGAIKNLAIMCAAARGEMDSLDAVVPLRLSMGTEELKALLATLSSLPRSERMRTPGMDAKRVDGCIAAGTLALMVMRALGIARIDFCDSSLREGVIVDYIGTHRSKLMARATWPDPRARSVIQLAERCDYRRAHAEQVRRLALDLFDQLKWLHGLDPRYRELLGHACLLHDVGYLISHQGHHKHSYYLIRNGELRGFGDQEIEVIANIARYHRKDRPKKSHFSYRNLEPRHRGAVRKLSVLLRLANAMDRTHYQVVEGVVCERTPEGVRLELSASRDAELELWTIRRHVRLFAREFRVGLEIYSASDAASS